MSDPDAPIARWTVRASDHGRRLVDVLRERVPWEPVERVRRTIESRVTVSWAARATPDLLVPGGGVVSVHPESIAERPDDTPIPVLAHGDGWFAVDKPAGVPVHPVRSVRLNSVIERLRRSAGEDGLTLAHRLDRDTSGALLIARDRVTAARLGRAFARCAVRKSYLAVVRGRPVRDRGVIDRPVGPDRSSMVRVRMAVGVGRPARTSWEIVRLVRGGAVLRVVPATGRRHQIRVHLESIGHPIAGDILYGRPDRDYLDLVEGRGDPRTRDGGPTRMLLHCERLTLDWPELRFDIRAPVGRATAFGDPSEWPNGLD